jgi:hypothetical protein
MWKAFGALIAFLLFAGPAAAQTTTVKRTVDLREPSTAHKPIVSLTSALINFGATKVYSSPTNNYRLAALNIQR